MSHIQRGQPPMRNDDETMRLAHGLSVFDSLERAVKRLTSARPISGNYVAVLEIPESVEIPIERTGKRPGHWTIWPGDRDMLEFVTEVIPVNVERGTGDDSHSRT